MRWVGRYMKNEKAPSAMEMTKMHFRVLDSWRGVAALLVAIFHLNLYSALYPLDFIRNAYLFVDFFFVLSGFVITHSYAARLGTIEELGSFALKRFGRLWPLHVAVLLAFLAVESAKAADKYVRENPYKTAGIALGVGALIGYLLSRRSE